MVDGVQLLIRNWKDQCEKGMNAIEIIIFLGVLVMMYRLEGVPAFLILYREHSKLIPTCFDSIDSYNFNLIRYSSIVTQLDCFVNELADVMNDAINLNMTGRNRLVRSER